MKYYIQHDGEWFQPRGDYRMACCDCGLVHRMEFRVVDGHIQFRAFRDKRSTAQVRRHGRIPANPLGVSHTPDPAP